MKKILFAAILLLGGVSLTISCTDYQDEIDALDYRIRVLENLVNRLNTDLESMQIIVEALETGDYITNVREVEGGYIVNFHKAGPIEIIDGKDGENGKDAQAPDISVEQDPTDNQWYWKLNGQWLAVDGKRIRANGHDGQDGIDGKDAVSPQVRINSETGIWEISVDGGSSWISTGTSATGRDGKDGEDGKDGADGNQFFWSVTYEVNSDGEFMVIVTMSGQTFRIPIYKN